MEKMGIPDPTKVVRAALQNAASIAGLLITTEATVAEKPKKDDGPAMPPGVMGGMDGMMQGARATSSRTESPASSGAFLVRGVIIRSLSGRHSRQNRWPASAPGRNGRGEYHWFTTNSRFSWTTPTTSFR